MALYIYFSMCKYKKVKEKKLKQAKPNLKQYIFELRKLKNTASFEPIFADFSAIPRPQETKPIKDLYPFYLRDNHPFTPSFVFPILGPYDFSQITTPTEDSLNQKQKQQDSVLITKAEPQPGMFFRICGVCRRQYDQYFSHIQSEVHKNWLKESAYQEEIKNFCQFYGKSFETLPQTGKN